jgi:hypothetical protein
MECSDTRIYRPDHFDGKGVVAKRGQSKSGKKYLI